MPEDCPSKTGELGFFDRLSVFFDLVTGVMRAGQNREEARKALRDAAQLAVQVEFTTIPVYLTGLYSITDKGSEAYQLLRSVVMEEMFHVNQAANLLVALGGRPILAQKGITPEYPCYLPKANKETTPFVGLYRASANVFNSIYAAIETPAAADAPPQGDNYDTIGQLYEFVERAIRNFDGNPFEPKNEDAIQRTDIYVGKFGGCPVNVTDKAKAYEAINQIVQQGEGSVHIDKPLTPVEAHGSYNHYGTRTDGTYGPIIGTPYELSHFLKFRKIALNPDSFPDTLPIMSNPKMEDITNPTARTYVELFNLAYTVMLVQLEKSFLRSSETAAKDPYFGVVLNLMHDVLPNLALTVMNTPAHLDGDSSVGPNAAPTWEFIPGATLQGLYEMLGKVVEESLKFQDENSREAKKSLKNLIKGLDDTLSVIEKLIGFLSELEGH